MNDPVILWQTTAGTVAMTVPSPGYDPVDVAEATIPEGQPYILVDRSELPPDDGFWFEAWEADFSNPDGYGGPHHLPKYVPEEL